MDVAMVLQFFIAFMAALAAVALALVLFLSFVLPWALRPEAYSFRGFSLTERLLTQGHILMMYLGQILMPTPDRLVFYYDNFPVSTGLLSPPITLGHSPAFLAIRPTSVLLKPISR